MARKGNNNIEKLLSNTGKTKVAMAKACGVAEATIYNWCKNITQPKSHYFPLIASFFNVTLEEVYGPTIFRYGMTKEEREALVSMAEIFGELYHEGAKDTHSLVVQFLKRNKIVS